MSNLQCLKLIYHNWSFENYLSLGWLWGYTTLIKVPNTVEYNKYLYNEVVQLQLDSYRCFMRIQVNIIKFNLHNHKYFFLYI